MSVHDHYECFRNNPCAKPNCSCECHHHVARPVVGRAVAILNGTVVGVSGGVGRASELGAIAARYAYRASAALDRAEKAESAIQRVRELHAQYEFETHTGAIVPACVECEEVWPCTTIAALDGHDRNETVVTPTPRPFCHHCCRFVPSSHVCKEDGNHE